MHIEIQFLILMEQSCKAQYKIGTYIQSQRLRLERFRNCFNFLRSHELLRINNRKYRRLFVL